MNILVRSGCALALAFAVSGPARAADPAETAVAVHDWSGAYAGVQGGYAWGNSTTFEMLAGAINDGPLDYDTDGFLGGIHLGYNRQSGAFVYGVEADLEYADVDGYWDWQNTNGLSRRLDWMGSLRARAGYAFDRVFLYGTAGLAFAHVKMQVIDSNAVALSKGEWTAGWTIGAGAEYALTSTLTLRAEYRYSDYGDTSVTGPVFGDTFTYPHDNKINALRIGVSMKF